MKNMINQAGMALALMVCCTSCAHNPVVTAAPGGPVAGVSEASNSQSRQRNFSVDPLTTQRNDSQAGQLISQLSSLADQLEKSIDRSNIANTFIITSFVNIDSLSETSRFGRLMAENLIYELNARHWKVFDVRFTKGIIINESGEFSLSRDGEKIRDAYKVGGIVVGTYSFGNNHIIVNARVIDIDSGAIISAGQIHLPVNGLTGELLNKPVSRDAESTIKIVGGADGK